jgi:uroporphyrinogen-III synthase
MPALHVIRPEPGCSATVAAARKLRLDARGTPLFEIHPCDWDLPDGRFDAVIAGSANAFRHGGENLARLHDLPIYGVGEATTEAARDLGFTIAATGTGGLQELLAWIDPSHRRLLRLAGAERVALEPPKLTELVERVVYASDPLAMPESLADALRTGGIVLLHSAVAARHFAAECDRLAIPRAGVSLAAIGPRVAAATGAGWGAIASAIKPNDAALLALARGMCQ